MLIVRNNSNGGKVMVKADTEFTDRITGDGQNL